MHPSIPTNYVLLFPPVLALGWYGTRTAFYLHHTNGSRGDRLSMLVLGWCPLVSWLLALLLSTFERHP